jgi:biopolymer transport protein ExbD
MATDVSRNDGKPYSDINMTPLIDVMLVLLIIFIITIPTQTHAVKIDNPLLDLPPPTRPEVIALSIDFDGTLFIGRGRAETITRSAEPTGSARQAPRRDPRNTASRAPPYRCGTP